LATSSTLAAGSASIHTSPSGLAGGRITGFWTMPAAGANPGSAARTCWSSLRIAENRL
jgi:hypothetical protein